MFIISSLFRIIFFLLLNCSATLVDKYFKEGWVEVKSDFNESYFSWWINSEINFTGADTTAALPNANPIMVY
ncbi:MAG: hypothetical protein J7604_07170 [Sporocytophaga sp.]|nr:hypothetical protein [Sporocytophaga sp.]